MNDVGKKQKKKQKIKGKREKGLGDPIKVYG